MPTSRPASQGRGGKVLPEVEGLHKRSIYIREAQTEYVPTITEEERAALEYRARNEGWQSTRRLLRFYGKFLIPVFYCTTLFFICFSLLAYAIPNWLCHEAALESAGAQFGLQECMFNAGGTYSHLWGAKLFWLLFWAMVYAFATLYPGMLCVVGMMGEAVGWSMAAIMGAISAVPSISILIMGPAFNMSLDNIGIVIIYTVLSFVITLISGVAVRRHTRNPVTYWRWVVCLVAMGPVAAFYQLAIGKVITQRSELALNGMGLTIFRYLVHPVIWSLVQLMFRNAMRHIGNVPDLTQSLFLIYPLLYSAVYGRFLLIQLSNVGSIIVQNGMQAFWQLGGAAVDRVVDGFVMNKLYGDRTANALTALPALDNQHLAEVLTNSITQWGGTIAAAALMSFAGITNTPGVRPNQAQIWYNAGLQCMIQLFQDFTQLAVEGKYHNFDWPAAWAKKFKRVMIIMTILITIASVHLVVMLLELYCPYHSDQTGLLLEQCDTPSMFQAFNFAFALRNSDNFIGRKLGITRSNNTAGINAT